MFEYFFRILVRKMERKRTSEYECHSSPDSDEPDSEYSSDSEDDAWSSSFRKPEDEEEAKAYSDPEECELPVNKKRARMGELRTRRVCDAAECGPPAGAGSSPIVIDDYPVLPPASEHSVVDVSSTSSGSGPDRREPGNPLKSSLLQPFLGYLRHGVTQGASDVQSAEEGEYSVVVDMKVQIIPDTEFGRDKLRCHVCLDRYANVVTLPCGHIVMCELCALHYEIFDMLNSTKPRGCCIACNSEIKQQSVVLLPFNNNELIGYKECLMLAQCAIVSIFKNDASDLKIFDPIYLAADSMERMRKLRSNY